MTTYGYTKTETFTQTDVAKVFENFEAGLCLIARTTGLWTVDYARDIAYDIIAFAKADYLSEAHIILMDAAQQAVRVHEYKVATDALGWTVHRPDGNVWPPTPGGSLTVFVRYSPAWLALGTRSAGGIQEGAECLLGPVKHRHHVCRTRRYRYAHLREQRVWPSSYDTGEDVDERHTPF
jgi:hypothetical protein